MQELKDKILELGIVKNDMINPSCKRKDRKLFYTLQKLEPEIKKYTLFLPEEIMIEQRIYHILYSPNESIVCKESNCKKIPTWKNFRKGYGSYCSLACYHKDLPNYEHWTNHTSQKKKDEIYGNMVKARRNNGSFQVTQETRNKMSKSAKGSMDQKRKTCKERYGVSNPGVLGGNSSNAARTYIKMFIDSMALDDDLCLYDDGFGKEEFWQMIEVPFKSKLRYTKYDLVVFKDMESLNNRDIHGIQMVLEYNGPWHYRQDRIQPSEYEESATPYPNSMTKMESVQLDVAKRNHFSHVGEYYEFWESEKCLFTV